jgi:hypothetical protein
MPDAHLPEELIKPVIDEPPPFLGSWGRVYVAVICYLAIVIALAYWFSRSFAA